MYWFLTELRPAGTISFRLAARKYRGQYGGNAQNTPSDFLNIFEAPEGHKIVQCDQDGAEARVVAWLAPSGRLRRFFKCGIKPHSYVAMHLEQPLLDPLNQFQRAEPEDLIKHPDWKAKAKEIKNSGVPYDNGKRVQHGYNYRMGARTLSDTVLKNTNGRVVISVKKAEYYLNVIRMLEPEVIEYHHMVESAAINSGVLRNLFGYPRRCDRPHTPEYLRDLTSWQAQSTVGIITIKATKLFLDKVMREKRKNWWLINNKHDSYAVIVPDADVEECKAFMLPTMTPILRGTDEEFQMLANISVGQNWGKYDKETNPLGMIEL